MISTEQHPDESEALFRLALDRTCPTARDKGAADRARVTGERMHRGMRDTFIISLSALSSSSQQAGM